MAHAGLLIFCGRRDFYPASPALRWPWSLICSGLAGGAARSTRAVTAARAFHRGSDSAIITAGLSPSTPCSASLLPQGGLQSAHSWRRIGALQSGEFPIPTEMKKARGETGAPSARPVAVPVPPRVVVAGRGALLQASMPGARQAASSHGFDVRMLFVQYAL